ncbi:rhomboid family intramembrane serine protease [Hyphomonas sp. FCG-A18]|uniref:rhomboid family intramembrane serine protease n=1 Tax=Hyphomonas sp. FCG-A18 TaxID=3080019 RepID=UPI002B2AF15B|nr:rhomboid family intramembrane serine protease [Hyphomonas sp. FCG-A18]
MEVFYQSPATFVLIAANVIASMIAFSNPRFMEQNLFHVGPILQGREWHRIVTSGFLHGGFFHLLINMYVLYGFGRLLEHPNVLGTGGFLIVYGAALLGGSFWSLLENRRKPDYRALGASGATSGIILSVCLFAPFATLILFVIPMPAVVFGVVFIVLSAVLAQRENKVIGHEAHLGGALAGLIATMLVRPDALSIFSEQVAARLGGG